MKTWFSRLLPVVGLVLIVLSLTSALRPDPPVREVDAHLLLRQIGHEYLRADCDSTSRIPAVKENTDGSLLLPLSRVIDYNLLGEVARKVLLRREVNQEYTLRLQDAQTNEVFLGAHWPEAHLYTTEFAGNIACTDRDQEARPSDIRFSLLPPAAPGGQSPHYWLLAVGSLCFFMGLLQYRSGRQPAFVAEAIAQPSPVVNRLQLGSSVQFLPREQKLQVAGELADLTFREAKLLSFLAGSRNIVLDRQTIHDAVWGDEGVMVGRSLDVFVSRLRKKLKGVDDVEIQTVHGVGYRFRC